MRPRFSLRTFLITVALFATAFGAFAFWRQAIIDRTQLHLKAMDDLNLQKGVMVAKKPHPNTPYINFVRHWIHPRAFEVTEQVCASRSFSTPQNLKLLKDLNGLSNIRCSFDRFTRRDAEEICNIPELTELHLMFDEAEESAADMLASNKSLTSLTLDGNAGPTFATALQQHPSLTKLWLTKAPLTTQDAQAIASIPNLTQFTAGPGLDGEILPILLKTKLKLLVLTVRTCDANSLAGLANSQLEQVHIACRSFPPGALAAAAKTPHLRELTLNGQLEFAPGEFETLSQCTKLERLLLPSVWLTTEQWKVLTDLPKLNWLVARSAESAEGCATKFLDSNPKRKFNGN